MTKITRGALIAIDERSLPNMRSPFSDFRMFVLTKTQPSGLSISQCNERDVDVVFAKTILAVRVHRKIESRFRYFKKKITSLLENVWGFPLVSQSKFMDWL